MIQVTDCTKRFGSLTAVDKISFSVRAESFFAFLGPNGAGKSTTIAIISTLLHPDGGTVTVAGFAAGRENDKIRRRIGIVFQYPVLDDLLTVRENITTRASLYNIRGKELRSRIDFISSALSMEDILDRRYGILSGGQRRRADIGRALINKPAVLFLDEPTTGLDPQTRIQVWETIKTIREQYKTTIFLTTHYMEEAAKADDIVIIDHGKVIAAGTPAQLRVRYSTDHLSIAAKEPERFSRYLDEHGITAKRRGELFCIDVADSLHALQLLKQAESQIDHFEMTRGSMDDVFIALTGRAIRDGGQG